MRDERKTKKELIAELRALRAELAVQPPPVADVALRESEARFRTLADAAFEGMAVTLDGVVVDCNARLAEMLGCRVADLIGANVMEFVAPESRATVLARIQTHDEQPYEHMARRRDGSVFPVEVHGRLMRAEGKTLRVSAIRDITERRKADEALRASEAHYRAYIEHASYGIYRSTPDGRFLMVNKALAGMLGYPSTDALLKIDLSRDLYADPTVRQKLVKRSERMEQIEPVECQWKRWDGSLITVRLSGRPVRDDDGAIACFEMMAEDVTQRKHLEAQLQQAQKMEAVGQLTTGIAHDFNNMLAVILANAQLLQNAPPDAVVAGLQEIEEAAQRGSAVVRQLLGFSRRADLAIVPTRLEPVVNNLTPMLHRVLPSSLAIRVSMEGEIGVVQADARAVEQVLVNLATNARDAMPDGGELFLDVRNADLDREHLVAHPWVVPGHYVRISVRDTGEGMDEKTKASLFEPFFTTKPIGLGTGLGMSMVYGLMKQHEGFVDVESQPGVGTTVSLYFPVAAGAVVPAKLPAALGEIRGGTETILLVDDEDALRRTGRRALERFGYTVLAARDGEEALEMFRSAAAPIDLVVSDLAMPRRDGWGLYRALRDGGNQVKFILASGYRESDTQERLTIAIEVAFLQKPWTLTELAARVREVLDATD